MHLVTEILIEHVDCLYLRRPLESKVSYSLFWREQTIPGRRVILQVHCKHKGHSWAILV